MLVALSSEGSLGEHVSSDAHVIVAVSGHR